MDTVQTLVTVEVRYFAAARAAAGADTDTLDVPAGASVDDVLAAARSRHDAGFARVLERCSYLLDEVAVRDRGIAVPAGAVLDVLPPFAGG